jgi:hypothetical protein
MATNRAAEGAFPEDLFATKHNAVSCAYSGQREGTFSSQHPATGPYAKIIDRKNIDRKANPNHPFGGSALFMIYF